MGFPLPWIGGSGSLPSNPVLDSALSEGQITEHEGLLIQHLLRLRRN